MIRARSPLPRHIYEWIGTHVWSHSSESIRTWHGACAAINSRAIDFLATQNDSDSHISLRMRHHGIGPKLSSMSIYCPATDSPRICSSCSHRLRNRILRLSLSGVRCAKSGAYTMDCREYWWSKTWLCSLKPFQITFKDWQRISRLTLENQSLNLRQAIYRRRWPRFGTSSRNELNGNTRRSLLVFSANWKFNWIQYRIDFLEDIRCASIGSPCFLRIITSHVHCLCVRLLLADAALPLDIINIWTNWHITIQMWIRRVYGSSGMED